MSLKDFYTACPLPKPARRDARVDYSTLALPKSGEVRLKGNRYRRLLKQVYERDGQRCVACGSPDRLTPHHRRKRSQGRMDTLENLVTVCVTCHQRLDQGLMCLL